MRIEKSHRPWALISLVVFGAAAVAFVPYALRSHNGPSGGSALGLTYGIAGYAMMLFAGLLGVRKKVPVWRIGRGQTWMRGHLWLGALSLPVILFHAGFSTGGPLTTVLLILLFVVVISGLAGAAIQHFVPRMMTTLVPMETIYEEIPHIRAQLREEADQMVVLICGQRQEVAVGVSADAAVAAPRFEGGGLIEVESDDRARIRTVYNETIRPFLDDPGKRGTELSDARRAAPVFAALRKQLPEAAQTVVNDLENICEEARQLTRQHQIYWWLHGWLLVHVPLSITLLVLGAVHAVLALRY